MPNTIDELLAIGSTPDWIRPLWAIIRDLTGGPHCHFYLDRYCGRSVNDIKRLLKRHGVDVWGDIIAEDMIIFTVRQNQAGWTRKILERAGLPPLGTSGLEGSQPAVAKELPRPQHTYTNVINFKAQLSPRQATPEPAGLPDYPPELSVNGRPAGKLFPQTPEPSPPLLSRLLRRLFGRENLNVRSKK